jgi:hypothetical protein
VGISRAEPAGGSEQGWLDLRQIATLEVTSEDANFPIESVFAPKDGAGWRASRPGEQRIRLIFDEPVSLHRIELRFDEADSERTQEFTLRWSAAASDGSATEIVRQQWNFSPAGSTTEIERYTVDLDEVSVMELAILPDLHRRDAVATLASWRLA